MDSAVAATHKVERLVLASHFEKVFLTSIELRQSETIFGCIAVSFSVEVCVYQKVAIGKCIMVTLYFICDPFCR